MSPYKVALEINERAILIHLLMILKKKAPMK